MQNSITGKSRFVVTLISSSFCYKQFSTRSKKLTTFELSNDEMTMILKLPHYKQKKEIIIITFFIKVVINIRIISWKIL